MRLFLLFFSIGILSADSFTELKELYASDGPFSAGKKLAKLKPGILPQNGGAGAKLHAKF